MKNKDEKAAHESDEGNVVRMTPNKSFIDSDGHSLGDLKLQPYTPERVWAADSMGLRYGNLTKADIRQWRGSGYYPGMAGDVGIIIWLCSLTDLDEIASARRDPTNACRLAAEFAAKEKIISFKQKRFWQAHKVFLAIMDEINVVRGEPEDQKKTKQTVA